MSGLIGSIGTEDDQVVQAGGETIESEGALAVGERGQSRCANQDFREDIPAEFVVNPAGNATNRTVLGVIRPGSDEVINLAGSGDVAYPVRDRRSSSGHLIRWNWRTADVSIAQE